MLLSFIEALILLVPLLLAVAFLTLAERKAMGSMQRRVGPNKVGYYGLLQPFSDALKLLTKENIIPSHSNSFLFIFSPILFITAVNDYSVTRGLWLKVGKVSPVDFPVKIPLQYVQDPLQPQNFYIVENGKPDLVHIHIPIKSGLAGIWIKREYGIPYILTEHWGIYNEVVEDNYTTKPAAFKKYTRKIFDNAYVFTSVSKYLAEGVNRFVTKKEYKIIPNVADTSSFYYRQKPISAFRFIHVSNMVPLKNAEGILRAFSLLLKENRDAILVMVGDKFPFLHDLARELGIPAAALLFCGEIPYEQVATEMQESDCLVLFSNMENSPCVIVEALCCGLPVIATGTGGIPELVNSTNGILLEPKDDRMLAAAMGEMMDNYSMYDRDKIAEQAIGKFSYQVIGKMMDDIYQDPNL